MQRILLIAFLAMFFYLPGAGAQQEIGLRAGEHTGYSRLVFDLGADYSADVKKDKAGILRIGFKQALEIASFPGGDARFDNISGLHIVSKDPLRIIADIPKDSRVRHFTAGNRLIIDIYDSPSGVKREAPFLKASKTGEDSEKKQHEAEKTALPESSVGKSERKAPEPAPVDTVQAETAEAAPPQQEALRSPDPQALSETPPGSDKKNNDEQPATETRSGVISISSTKATGLAAFAYKGHIWIVDDTEDDIILPQIAGKIAAETGPFKKAEISEGRAHIIKDPENVHLRTEGGGLVWRVILSSRKKEKQPARPLRLQEAGKIVFPFEAPDSILEATDPVSGAILKIVTVKNAKDFVGDHYDFIEFEVLPSAAGLAVHPKVDDLTLQVTERGVEIFRPGGLAISSESQVEQVTARKAVEENAGSGVQEADWKRVVYLQNWVMGGVQALEENEMDILADIQAMPENQRPEQIVNLAKMYLANAHAPEASGFLRLAENAVPGLAENPQFTALKAMAQALSWQSRSAFENFSRPEVRAYPETGYWRAFALADLGDWAQAKDVMPARFDVLQDYPDPVFNRLALALAEVALRAGNVKDAKTLLDGVEARAETLLPPQQAALRYLRAEAARQQGDVEKAKSLWNTLASGADDFYRAKSGLALTRLQLEAGEISNEQAIDRLERLRYAWRGDQLEAQIHHWLGRTYIKRGEYVRGLGILREAAALAPETDLGRRITNEMSETFAKLFLEQGLADVNPLEATALYEQFSELVPPGEKGNAVVEQLAEHLVQADLLERAADLLQYQIKHRVSGFDRYRLGVRLAAVSLLDKKPVRALEALEGAETVLNALPEAMQTVQRRREITLLRAHALAENGRPDKALSILGSLERGPDVHRLQADIAWNAGYWDEAALALENVIIDRDLSFTRPLEPADAELILRRAVALNLADDRVALANLREKYGDAMAQTERAKVFEVITRPRRSAMLADRETLLGIVSEVDLFGDFLESYRGEENIEN